MKDKKYNPLPNIEYLESLMLLGQVSRIGFTGTLSIGRPTISDEQYMEIIKEEVSRSD